MRRKGKGTRHILLVALLLLTAVGAMGISHNPALAEGSLTVVRDLPEPATCEKGDTFEVTITFTATEDEFNAIVLHDEAPAGWQVTVDKDACIPPILTEKVVGDNGIEYTWMGPYHAGQIFRAVYEVTVPEATTGGTHNMPGGWLMYFIVTDEHQAAITGESEVLIKSGTAEVPPAADEETVIGDTPDTAGTASDFTPAADITKATDSVAETPGTQVGSPAPESTQDGSQAAVPEPAPSESNLLYPPAPKSEPVNWPAIWGIAGGIIFIIVLVTLIRLRRRQY